MRGLLLVGLLAGAAAGTLHFFGDALVPSAVDAVRGLIGAEGMAEIESRYYGLVETTHQWQHDLGLAPRPVAPWAVSAVPMTRARRPLPLFTPTLPTSRPAMSPTAVAQVPPTSVKPAVVAQMPRPTLAPAEGPNLIDTLPSALPSPPASVTPLPKPAVRRKTSTPLPRPTMRPTDLPTVPPTSVAAALLTAVAGLPTAPPPTVAAPPTQGTTGGGPLAAPPSLSGDIGWPIPLYPLIQDGTLAGEGVWTSDGLPQPPDGGPPAFWKTYLRPDPARPDAQVYMVQFDPRRLRLHFVAGTTEPVPTDKVAGPGEVAAADLPSLAAAFNGGWKSVHGNYGMLVHRHLVAPPNTRGDTATLAVHADGRVELASWKKLSKATDLVSYRQNCPMLIDNGVISVQGHLTSTWGLSLLSEMYVWRSGIGQTADGSLIFAAGNPVSAAELASALEQAGAVTAMQLDINSAWVHWLSYSREAPTAPLHASALVPGMSYRRNQYLTPAERDFFYLTWR